MKYKDNRLNDVQVLTVRQMIVDSMSGVCVNDKAIMIAKTITDNIIHNIQKALIQSSVFEAAVENSKPLKKNKSVKKVKKHVRK